MAAGEYLKVAAGQLVSAANAVKHEADRLRSDAANFKRQAEHDITAKEHQIGVHRQGMTSHHDDPKAVATNAVLIKKVQKEIDTLRQDIAQKTSQTEQALRAKESTVQGLMSQAQSLERQASDPGLQ